MLPHQRIDKGGFPCVWFSYDGYKGGFVHLDIRLKDLRLKTLFDKKSQPGLSNWDYFALVAETGLEPATFGL